MPRRRPGEISETHASDPRIRHILQPRTSNIYTSNFYSKSSMYVYMYFQQHLLYLPAYLGLNIYFPAPRIIGYHSSQSTTGNLKPPHIPSSRKVSVDWITLKTTSVTNGTQYESPTLDVPIHGKSVTSIPFSEGIRPLRE